MKHAAPGYDCPFCRLAETLSAPSDDAAVVLIDTDVFAFVPLHQYADIDGNCLIVPRAHHENVMDIPDHLGTAFFAATRRLAKAMQRAFNCQGISTRQHNGPAGDQDVWHYHLHVFPRYPNDGLYLGKRGLYSTEKRVELAGRLRAAMTHEKAR